MDRGTRVLALGLLAAAFGVAPSPGQQNPCAPPNRCLGPNFPALIDTNGDGQPTPGDMPLVPVYDPATNQIYVDNPWDSCGHPQFRTIFVLSNPQPGTGIPMVATGMDIKGNHIVITATSFTGMNEPMLASFNSSMNSIPNAAGTGSLIGPNSSGFFDTLEGTSTMGQFVGTIQIPLAYFPPLPTIPQYVSIPWTAANLAFIGVNTEDNCGPPGIGGLDPQIWIPLANGRIILDLDGNGLPDPGVFQSPPLAPAGVPPTPTSTPTSTPTGTPPNTPTQTPGAVAVVPTLSPRATLLLVFGLVLAAWFALRRGGLGV